MHRVGLASLIEPYAGRRAGATGGSAFSGEALGAPLVVRHAP